MPMPGMGNPAMSPEVQQAMQRRQMGGSTPQLQQQSPQAPGQEVMPPANPSSLGQPGPNTPSAPSQKYEPQNQEDVIVQALIEQLKTTQKLKKETMTMGMGGDQPRTPAPSAPPMGGESGGQSLRGISPFTQSTSNNQGM